MNDAGKGEAGLLSVSVVVPVYNEEDNLEPFIARSLAACRTLANPYEIVLVDDGSRDKSAAMLSAAAEANPGEIVCLLLNRNYGQHSAIMAGFAEARGDIVITLDADLQNPPEEIPRLVECAAQGFDVVGTVRINREDSGFRKFASSIVNKMTAKATGVMMHDYGCMLRAYRRPIIDAMLECHERSTFIPVLANSFARNTTEIDVKHDARAAGESKYSVWKLINLQFDLLTSMTTFPLRLLSLVGSALAVFGIGSGITLLVLRLIYGSKWASEGVFTIFAFLFLLVGAQFIGMGLLGEYIGRIYQDVRARPRYFVLEIVGSSHLEDRPDGATPTRPDAGRLQRAANR